MTDESTDDEFVEIPVREAETAGESEKLVGLVLTRDIYGRPKRSKFVDPEHRRRLQVLKAVDPFEYVPEAYSGGLTTYQEEGGQTLFDLLFIIDEDAPPGVENDVPVEVDGVPVHTQRETIGELNLL
ncbi:hypothetical protein [Haloarchaeobius sp. DFWS5]|uniref:hypothetical protein n=1 Tax=Haloarchaeobius sp. DFWS5 TaxID=3446114 RepID=UPI003EB8016B